MTRDADRLRRWAQRAREWAIEARAIPNPSPALLRIANAKERCAESWTREADALDQTSHERRP